MYSLKQSFLPIPNLNETDCEGGEEEDLSDVPGPGGEHAAGDVALGIGDGRGGKNRVTLDQDEGALQEIDMNKNNGKVTLIELLLKYVKL